MKFTRVPRIKLNDASVVYHCMSHLVEGHRFFHDFEKDKFVSLMRRNAAFFGFEIITFCVMDNHFHILARLPLEDGQTVQQKIDAISDQSLIDRCRAFYGEDSKQVQLLSKELAASGKLSPDTRSDFTYRLFDVSHFMQSLKVSFSRWFNTIHNRKGTLWSERFESSVVEDKSSASQIIARYIDLNPVRAGLVGDPKDYRWCGYAEAVAGVKAAQNGIMLAEPGDTWEKSAAEYRMKLFISAGSPGSPDKAALSSEEIFKVLNEGGKIQEHQLVMLRVRHFIDGVAIGAKGFTNEIFAKFRDHFGERRKDGARVIPQLADSALTILRNFRKAAFTKRT